MSSTLIPPRPAQPPQIPHVRHEPSAAVQPASEDPRTGTWWKVLAGGAGLWVAALIVTAITRNANLVPTLILGGSFLVPFALVLWLIERRSITVPPRRMITAFFVGGVAGVLGASLLEANLSGSVLLLLTVGIIEEGVKLAILVVAARGIPRRSPLDGAALGAAVGAGFAAFESAGYALTTSFDSGSVSLAALSQTVAIRGLLAPTGHILWTALLGAALLWAGSRAAGRMAGQAAKRGSRWWVLIGTFAGVAALHTAWDLLGPASSLLAAILTGALRFQYAHGFVPAAYAPVIESTALSLYIVGAIVVAAIGVGWLLVVLRVAGRRSQGSTNSSPSGMSSGWPQSTS